MQVKKDFQEAVLSYRQDEFFHKNMYANFGDIGSAVKELVDEFQKQTTNTKRINTIEDMQVSSQGTAPLLNVLLWHLQFTCTVWTGNTCLANQNKMALHRQHSISTAWQASLLTQSATSPSSCRHQRL